MFNHKTSLLLLTSDSAELWCRKGRILTLIGKLDPSLADYGLKLKQLLIDSRAYAIGLIIHLPIVSIQHEALPKINFLDRRKLLARRLSYLFPHAYLRGLQQLEGMGFFASMRAHPNLTKTINTIVACKSRLEWIAHTALESRSLMPKSSAPTAYMALISFGQTGILLAGNGNLLLTLRLLDSHQLSHEGLAAELTSTHAYLQRHGWKPGADLAFTGIGLDLPSTAAQLFTKLHLSPNIDGQAELLAQLATRRRPTLCFSRSQLQRLSQLWLIKRGLNFGAAMAAILTIGSLWLYQRAFVQATDIDTMFVTRLASLPPPLIIQDVEVLKRLRDSLAAPASLLNIPSAAAPQSLSYTAGPFQADVAPSLRITALSPIEITGWQLQAAKNGTPISGNLDRDTSALSQIYNYSYKGIP